MTRLRMRRRIYLSFTMLAIGAGLCAAAVMWPEASGAERTAEGGTFRISVTDFDYVDPALAYHTGSWAVLRLTCAGLVGYPDKPPQEGYRIVPEVAAGWPDVSADGRTYTFTIRRGFRFSDGRRVTAGNFAHAFGRLANSKQRSPIGLYAANIDAVKARGRQLVVRLKRPSADLVPRLTMPFFCPVPLGLPIDPEGVEAPLPGSGPYYVRSWTRERRVVLERNRRYRGKRPHHADRFVFYLDDAPETIVGRIERGERDWGQLSPTPEQLARLRRTYGVNRRRYFETPSTLVELLYLNTARPLFRNNARLRRAVNYAIDRKALLAQFARRHAPTDQYLPPVLPGYREAHIYPSRPNLKKARSLAQGRRGEGKAVMYVRQGPVFIAIAQLVQKNLRAIGIDVELRLFPTRVFFQKISTRGEPFDIAYAPWQPEYVDPYDILNVQLDGRTITAEDNFNHSFFDSSRYNRRLAQVARLTGSARYRAYGKLDIELARDAAPMAAFGYSFDHNLFSARVGCVVMNAANPGAPDLAAVCLRR
jgi:peptide/nickel transport system substrate-binding protein